MKTKAEILSDITFINFPKDKETTIGKIRIDSSIPIPIQWPAGCDRTDVSNIGFESIIAGMLKIIAWDRENEHFSYYRDFVNEVQPEAAEQLTIAAIAKDKGDDPEFAEELFLTVKNLLPQSATYINLATHYSKMSADSKGKDDVKYDYYLQKALDVLNEGVEMFPENTDLLSEIGYFHLFQNNLELASSFFEKYLSLAEDSEQKKHISDIMGDINRKLSNDANLLQAYDEIQLGHEEDALRLLDKYLETSPKVWNAHFFKGWALRRLERYDEAEKSFLQVLKLGEKNSDLYNELAICSLENGNRELAKAYLSTAIDLDGDNLKIMSNLAYLHLNDKEYDQSRELLEKCRYIDKNDPVIKKLMEDYERETGEKLGDIIREEYVDTSEVEEKHDELHHSHN